MTIARFAALVLLALPLAADPIADVRAALTRLPAHDPIRATYEIQQSVANEGKFDNDTFSGKASIELEAGEGGLRFFLTQPVLTQIAQEQDAKNRNNNMKTPTVSAMHEIDPVETANAVDFAPVLLRLLEGARLVSDAQATWAGKPARAMVLRVKDNLDDDDKGRVKISENRLTLWLGPDLVPLAAEHLVSAKFSFLIFKGETKQRKSWHLAHVADRLVRVHYESQQSSSGMGQKGNETIVATLRVH